MLHNFPTLLTTFKPPANTESLIIYLAVGILSSLVSVVLVLLLLYGCYAIKKSKS